MSSTSSIPCRFFQIGQCSAGSSCKFSHARGSSADGQQQQVALAAVCKFWLQGHCVHGKACAFRHERQQPAPAPARAAPVAVLPAPRTPVAAPRLPDAATLHAMPLAVRRTHLGNALYPRIVSLVGSAVAGRVCGMMLEMQIPALLALLSAPTDDGFRAAVEKAIAVLPVELRQRVVRAPPPAAAVATATPSASATTSEGGSASASFSRSDAARSITPTAAELAYSSALTCGICLENVMGKGRGSRLFGLLENCEHVFCLPCLRQWRDTHAIRPEVARSCPECRAPSHFIVPSSLHVSGPRKATLVAGYLGSLHKVPCRHFAFGEGRCPFGNSCFYAHTDKQGRPVVVEPRHAAGAAGPAVLPSYRLSDYLFPEGNSSMRAGANNDAEGAFATDALLASIPLVEGENATVTRVNDEQGGERSAEFLAVSNGTAPAVDVQ